MGISIHALLAESDLASILCTSVKIYFYPRSPCGERLATVGLNLVGQIFLSTLSLRRATGKKSSGAAVFTISIHALLAESDRGSNHGQPGPENFYPRSPCGERLPLICDVIAEMTISIHALLAESDSFNPLETIVILAFLSTLSLRRAT